MVFVWSVCRRVYGCGLGVVAACRRRAVALAPRRGDLQGERLAGPRGDARGDGVPPQAAVHLIKVAPHVGFGGEGFEAHRAGFSSWCAESPGPTSSIIRNIYFNKREFTLFILLVCFHPKMHKELFRSFCAKPYLSPLRAGL